jgi:hypothetical protein
MRHESIDTVVPPFPNLFFESQSAKPLGTNLRATLLLNDSFSLEMNMFK